VREFPDRPFGSNFEPKFYSARYFGNSVEKRTLNINRETIRHQNISAHLNVFSGGVSRVETQDRRADAVNLFFSWNASKFYRVNNNFGAVRGVEFISGEFESFPGQPSLFGRGQPKGEGESGYSDGGERGKRAIVFVDERALAQQEQRDMRTTRDRLVQMIYYALLVRGRESAD